MSIAFNFKTVHCTATTMFNTKLWKMKIMYGLMENRKWNVNEKQRERERCCGWDIGVFDRE